MRKQIYLYNQLLIIYNRSRAKLARLISLNKNERKQGILKRRIAKLIAKLTGMQKALRVGLSSVALVAATTAFPANEAGAQSFATELTNSFGLNSAYINRPAFADLDNDGDMDMMIGDTLGNNVYYKNSGTASLANFDPPVMNPFGLTAAPYTNYPYFVDIDNDGDFDLLTGDVYGFIYYNQNTGTASAPAFAATTTLAFSLPLQVTGEYTLTISMADIDNDGDKDLFAGGFYGDFHYFPNNGTASAASFGSELTNPFGINVTGDSLVSPTLKDLDGDGDFDLLSGSYAGDFHYYQNTGTVSAPAFAAPVFNPFGLTALGGGLSLPTLVDLDNDGDFDLLSGDYYYGDWHYFQNTAGSGIESLSDRALLINAYPNPVVTNLTVQTGHYIPNSITLCDASGKTLRTITPSSSKTSIDMSTFTQGVYFIKVVTDNDVQTLNLVKK